MCVVEQPTHSVGQALRESLIDVLDSYLASANNRSAAVHELIALLVKAAQDQRMLDQDLIRWAGEAGQDV